MGKKKHKIVYNSYGLTVDGKLIPWRIRNFLRLYYWTIKENTGIKIRLGIRFRYYELKALIGLIRRWRKPTEDDFDFPINEVECDECHGSGEANYCIDDLCQGEECIHGDGVMMCRKCAGRGFLIFDNSML
jgi:hypothetical protein